MKIIEITQNKKVKVDDEDYQELLKYNWHCSNSGNGKMCAGRREHKHTIFMHRQITNCPKGLEIDHINGDTLDNRKDNLRICTHAENIRNRKTNINNASGYKGVRNNHGKWQAYLMFNGKFVYLGNFEEKIDAAKSITNQQKCTLENMQG